MDRFWLKNYQAGVVHDINPDAYSSINDVITQSILMFSEKPAFANMGKIITYAELDELITNFASYLQNDLNLPPGTRIAIVLPNVLQFPVALFGALKAGLVVVNVNPLYTARELEAQLKDSGAAAVVVLANFAYTLQQIVNNTQVKHIIITEIGDMLPFIKKTIVNFVVKYLKKMVPEYKLPNAVWFNTALKLGSKKQFHHVDVNGDDIAFLQYTGGTTGLSKGAVLTHRNMVSNMEQAHAWIKPVVSLGEEIIITALPMYHIFSLTANCLVFSKVGGLNVLITNPRDIPGFVKELSNWNFTAITGVNTLFNALLNHPKFSKLDFSSLHLTLGGGMAVHKSVAENWEKVTGVPLIEAYGLTEASPAVCINPMNLTHYNGSIGLPIPSTLVSIRDEYGVELAPGQIGELFVKGPQVMREYWHHPAETKKVLKDGWLSTGDMAKIDDQGFVFIVDRKKDMILISGFNVYPNEVEAVIAHHKDVLEVAVIGVTNANGDELVKAFIVKKNPQLTEDSIIDFCKKELTGYKVPKIIEFRDSLPKTNVGKILRRALREEKK